MRQFRGWLASKGKEDFLRREKIEKNDVAGQLTEVGSHKKTEVNPNRSGLWENQTVTPQPGRKLQNEKKKVRSYQTEAAGELTFHGVGGVKKKTPREKQQEKSQRGSKITYYGKDQKPGGQEV